MDNPEQLIVGAISLAALPAAAVVDLTLFAVRQDLALMISRLFIAVAYAAGAAYAFGTHGTADPKIIEQN